MEAYDYYNAIQLLGRPATYYPNICDALGEDIRAALFISNFFCIEKNQIDQQGWIYKSQKDIKKETGLSRASQEVSRKKLRELGILEEEKRGDHSALHYKFNWSKLNEVMAKYIAGEKPDKNVEDPLIYRMKVLFDGIYEKQIGLEYEWSKDKKGGKDWVNLQKLSNFFETRLKNKKKKALLAEDVTNEEIFESWQHFLHLLPEYARKHYLTPALLYSNVNKILIEITHNAQIANTPKPTVKSTASNYV